MESQLIAAEGNTMGLMLRDLREGRDLRLWQVASGVGMDSTLLSRIERGDRLPTEEQTRALAAFFKAPVDDFEAARIAAKFWKDHAGNPAAAAAIGLIRESAPEYHVNKSRKTVKKRANKS